MKRRQFLNAVGTLASGTLVTRLAASSNSVLAAEKVTVRPGEPRVFLYEDGRHAAGLYQFEPPLTPEDHALNVDQLANSGVDTFVYFAGVEGGTVLYDSKVAQLWGDATKKWTHYVWYRAARNLRQLIADGHDPLKILCDHSHKAGIWMIASAWVSVHGGERSKEGGLGRWSDFAMDNPQFQVGKDSDPKAKGIPAFRFSFLHAAVREERFRVFEELLSRYETDGIELNLISLMPFCRFSEVKQLSSIMTQWLGDLRAVADRAQQAQGRRKRIYVRIPAHPDAWSMVGYDVPTWISEGLVDGLMCVSSYGADEGLDQDVDLKPAVKLTRGTGCRVYYAFHSLLGRSVANAATAPMICAAAANTYIQGADGFGIGDHHWSLRGWPWADEEYQTLRLLGRPDLLATADKLYHVHTVSRSVPSRAFLPGRTQVLPKTLTPGQSVDIPFHIADNLKHWEDLGRLKSVRLRVRFANLEPHFDKVNIELNGALLPESILEKVDMTYRLLASGGAGAYGYAFDYSLGQERLPKQGRNVVKVALLERDPNLDIPFAVHNVDCIIEYRQHRHFKRQPLDY